MALQALAHRLLGHHEPQDYSEFLQQRLEINYFAAATLMPRSRAVEYLRKAKKERNLAVEDFRDAFGVTHETAAMRFTNLATTHLDLRVHFLRVGEDGALSRVYENDGIPIPVDASGHAEGQLVCRKFAARSAFERTSTTRSTSADRRPRSARSPPAPTTAAAPAPTTGSSTVGAASHGRRPACTSTRSRRCRRAPTPASTTPSSTPSSSGTPPPSYRARPARPNGAQDRPATHPALGRRTGRP